MFVLQKQKAENENVIFGNLDTNVKRKIIDYRRCIILAVIGGTPIETASLTSVVLGGFLNSVKQWLDEILSSPLGLSNVTLSANSNFVYCLSASYLLVFSP
jgi:hypothetical protein